MAEKPTYQKPSGSGKPKPSGGKGPVNESPNTFPSVPTNAPTTLSTWVIYKQQDTTTSPPTPLPTPSPTSAPNADFIVLNSSDSVNFEIISNSPTPALQVVSSGSVSTTQDDESCSGDPCPVSSHCRGSYGSCGPGFIYCNAKTIWSSSCPAKPTKEPTHGPTKVPTVKAPAAVPVLEPVANTPTLPTLPKPTLPYITGSTPVKLPDFSSSVHSVTPGDKKLEASDEAKEDDVKEEEPEKDSETDDIFLNKDYLNEFTEWTMSRNTGSSAGSFFMGFQFTFLAAISFICFV